jgi:hypothetical protein
VTQHDELTLNRVFPDTPARTDQIAFAQECVELANSWELSGLYARGVGWIVGDGAVRVDENNFE